MFFWIYHIISSVSYCLQHETAKHNQGIKGSVWGSGSADEWLMTEFAVTNLGCQAQKTSLSMMFLPKRNVFFRIFLKPEGIQCIYNRNITYTHMHTVYTHMGISCFTAPTQSFQVFYKCTFQRCCAVHVFQQLCTFHGGCARVTEIAHVSQAP